MKTNRLMMKHEVRWLCARCNCLNLGDWCACCGDPRVCSKQGMYGQKLYNGRSLTEIVNDWRRMLLRHESEHEDVDAYYAPAECHGLVNRWQDREEAAFYEKIGLSPMELRKEVIARTNERTAYYLLHI